MKKIFIIIGRFQPLHHGHSEMIQKALNDAKPDNSEVLILVGSSNKARSIDNPFTYNERRSMLQEHLEDIGATNCHIRPLPDFDYQDEQWEVNLHEVIAKFAKNNIKDRYFIPVFVSGKRGNDSELRESWKSGGETLPVEPVTYKSEDLSATMVRDHLATVSIHRIYEDDGLRSMLPLYSRKFIDEHPEVHQHIINERKAVADYKELWKDAPFTPIFQATDAFVVDKHGTVLLVERGGDIGKGQYAMAGGYLEPELTLFENMKKELLEETNLDLDQYDHEVLNPLTVDAPNRSHRGRIITTAFMIKLDASLEDLIEADLIKAGDDAERLATASLDGIKKGEVTLYSDHAGIINKLCEINNY